MVNFRTLALGTGFAAAAYYTYRTDRLNMYFRAFLVLLALWMFVGSFPLGSGTIPCWLGGSECGNQPPIGRPCEKPGQICVPPNYKPIVDAGYVTRGQIENGGSSCIDACCGKVAKFPQHYKYCTDYGVNCGTKQLPAANIIWPEFACIYKKHTGDQQAWREYSLVKGVPTASSPCDGGRVVPVQYPDNILGGMCTSNETTGPQLKTLCCDKNDTCFTGKSQCQLPAEHPAPIQFGMTQLTFYSVEFKKYLAFNGVNQSLTLLSNPGNPLCQWSIGNTQYENIPTGTNITYEMSNFVVQTPLDGVNDLVLADNNFTVYAGPTHGQRDVLQFTGGCGNYVGADPGEIVRSNEMISLYFPYQQRIVAMVEEGGQYRLVTVSGDELDPVTKCLTILPPPGVRYGTTWQIRGPNGKPIEVLYDNE